MLWHSANRTSCGRTSGRVCCTPQPAAAAPRPSSSRRWTPPGGCGWATGWGVSRKSSLPCPSTPGCGREGRGPTEQGDRHLAQKEEPKDWEGLGCLPGGTQKLVGTMKGHLTESTKKRVSARAWDHFLLVVPTEPGAELHEGCEGVSSGGWQGHMGL